MRARLVVVESIRFEAPTQMPFTNDQDMIQAFPSECADEPFDIGVLPRRSGCRRTVPNSHCSDPVQKNLTIESVIVADQVRWRGIPREGLDDLSRQPFGRWMSRYVEPEQLAAPVTDDNNCKQALECCRVNHK